MIKFIKYFVIIITLLFFIISCKEDITGEFEQNLPPDTFIFVNSAENDSLNYQQSVQSIYWDGRDPDGFVKGFYYTWEETPSDSDWIFTTNNSETFPLKISGTDTTYSFKIKAVDNMDLQDPTPAEQVFPIINSPPMIDWTSTSLVPDTTFTVAAFNWSATDPDGDSTISHFEYALDSPDNWSRIAGFNRSVTINTDSGLTTGDHAFYIRAVDIAGAQSEIIRMPQTGTWHVKAPKGKYLLIDDFSIESSATGFPDAFYRTSLKNVLTDIGDTSKIDYWNIEEQFPASRSQFLETMKLFDRIIWYTDLIQETDERFVTAQVAIPAYLNSDYPDKNRKIIYTVQFNTGFGGQGSPLDFSPVDSLGDKYDRMFPGSIYYVDDQIYDQSELTLPDSLPELQVSKFIVGLIAFKPKVTAVPMYRYQDPQKDVDPIFIMLGKNDNKSGKDKFDFVFAGTPLHLLRGNNNTELLFKIIFRDIF